jgi:hypothetical protein
VAAQCALDRRRAARGPLNDRQLDPADFLSVKAALA